MQTKVYYGLFYFFTLFYSVSLTTAITNSCKKVFSRVCVIGTPCFNECFLLHVVTERPCFPYTFIAAMRFFSVTMFLFPLRKSILKIVHILHYLHDNSLMLTPKFQNKDLVYQICRIFPINFTFWFCTFTRFLDFASVPHFSLKKFFYLFLVIEFW